MAELYQAYLLYQGRINEVEAELIERSILEEGVLHREELEFLLSLKKEAKWVHPRFDKFVFKVLKSWYSRMASLTTRKLAGSERSFWLISRSLLLSNSSWKNFTMKPGVLVQSSLSSTRNVLNYPRRSSATSVGTLR